MRATIILHTRVPVGPLVETADMVQTCGFSVLRGAAGIGIAAGLMLLPKRPYTADAVIGRRG